MPVTIYDIAAQAGVSIATVSRVFSGQTRVADDTRARVFQMAEALGYEPNVAAQNLARQTTQVIGAVVPMLTSYFFMEVIRGVQDELSEAGYDLLVYASRTPSHVGAQVARALQPGRADGLLLCSTPLSDAHAERLKASGACVVLVDSAHPAFDSVSVDNAEGGFVATRHLIAGGAQRVAMIAPHPDATPGVERRRGYERALAEAGLDVDPALVVASDEALQHGFTREAGYEAMRELLGRSPRPDAVFVASDVQALGALKALRDAGLRCPEDLALIGFDDIRTSAYVGLSTLRQPMYEMGRVATEQLLRRIADGDAPPAHTTFSPELIVRETSAAR